MFPPRRRDEITYSEPLGGAHMAPARAASGDADKQRRPALAEIRKMINVVPDADIKKFLAAELRKDGALLERFGALAGRSLAASRGGDYYAKVQRLLDTASGRGGIISHHSPYISLAGVMKDARAREKIGDYVEAARMYGQIADAIIDNLPRIYSVTERFRSHASRCIRAMGECAEKAGDARARMHIAKRLAVGYARDIDGVWVDEYEESLDKTIQAQGDRERLAKVIEGVLSAGPPAGLGKQDQDGWGKYLRMHGEYAEDQEGEGEG